MAASGSTLVAQVFASFLSAGFRPFSVFAQTSPKFSNPRIGDESAPTLCTFSSFESCFVTAVNGELSNWGEFFWEGRSECRFVVFFFRGELRELVKYAECDAGFDDFIAVRTYERSLTSRRTISKQCDVVNSTSVGIVFTFGRHRTRSSCESFIFFHCILLRLRIFCLFE